MKPSRFSYHRPETLTDALDHLASLEDVKILAGGQSLMPMMNYRYVAPAHLLDINRVGELSGIHLDGNALVIGAMTRQRELERSGLAREHCPLIAAALHWVGHVQTRNRGTVGGSLAHLDPAAELPAVFAALDATLIVQSTRGSRDIPIHDWPLGFMTPNLEPDELLCTIRVPLWPAGHGYGFHELARRHGDFAMATSAVLLARDATGMTERVAIAIAGVDVRPVRLHAAESLLQGREPTRALIAEASATAMSVAGLADAHADETYRRRLAEVMTRRALAAAVERAGGAC